MNFCSLNLNLIDDIHTLEKICFTDYYSFEILSSLIDNKLYGYSMALTENDVMIAYAIVYVVADESELHRVAVNPCYRNKGYGKAIINKCIENLSSANIKKMHLEVRNSNHGAICLYEKLGFELVGVRKGYYSDNNDDAMLYTLEL